MNSCTGPVGRLSAEKVETVLTAATAAPSLHNTQPWRFRSTPQAIELYADWDRALPATDPEGREALLACGAALCNMRIMLQSMGIHPVVELAADRRTDGRLEAALRSMGVRPIIELAANRDTDNGLLAVLRPAGDRPATMADKQLAAAIPRRRTNRRPFEAPEVPSSVRVALQRAAKLEGSWLVRITPALQPELRSLVRRAHESQLHDAGFLKEWRFWTGRLDGEPDGVPARSSGSLPEEQDWWVLRDYSGGRAATRVPGKDFEESPLLVVLGSFHDLPIGRLQAGQALQRVLLTATAHGLSASFLSQVIEVPSIRRELRTLLGGALWPQAVLRLGYGRPAPPTPRRGLSEVMIGGMSDTPPDAPRQTARESATIG